jgi:serine/threonine-protein kinase RsbT
VESGYTSKRTLGLGLPGARRLMDEFAIESEVGKGTHVKMVKWRMRDELERLREKRRQRA